MVKGRVVRPLQMGGHPSSSKQHQQKENQPNRRPNSASKRGSSSADRRRSLDNYIDHKGALGETHEISKYSSRRYERPRKKKPNILKRMKSSLASSFGNSFEKFRKSSVDDEKYYPSSDTKMDYMESQGRQGSSSGGGGNRPQKKDHRLSTQEIRRPFLVPSFATLSQRADLWIVTALSSCVSLASFAQLLTSSKGSLSTSNRMFAFSTSIITFVVAFVLGAAFRYAPLRHSFTRSLSIISPPNQRQAYGSPIIAGIKTAIAQSYISVELVLVSIVTFFWTIAIPIIVDGFNGIGQDPLAVFGMEIWNANLFYSSWISAILIGYIYIELLTSTDRYGRVPSTTSSTSSWKENTFSKRWILLTLSSIVVLSSSAEIYGSNLCDGDILKGTEYCQKALLGILVGGFVQLVCSCCVGMIYRLRNMDNTDSSASYHYDSKGRRRKIRRRYMRKKMSVWKREKYSLYFGIISLVVQTVNVAMLTDPVGGGPGNSTGTLYFASWLSFFLVVEMCLRYFELHTTSMGRKVKRKDEKTSGYDDDDADHSDATFPSEEDEDLPREKESTVMRLLRNGSVGGSSSGAPVYEEVDSFSAESPRYAIQPEASAYRAQPPPTLPRASSPPDSNLVTLNTQEPLERSQIDPEEEMKVSPNSSARDSLSESMRDFSIGSRRSSPDPSGDRLRALPPFSTDSASDDVTNDELFEVAQQASRAQSYVTQESNVSEEYDERNMAIPSKYDAKQGARHNIGNTSNLSPLNESSKEGRRSSDSHLRSQSGSERSASQSSRRSGSQQSGSFIGSRQSGSRHSGSRQSGSRQSGSYHSGSKHNSEHSPEMEQIPPPPVYRPKPVRQKSQSNRSKSKSRSRSGSRGKGRNASRDRKSQRNQEIYTDSDNDSAEDSPPPTISDSGHSQGSNLSGFSQRSPATKSRSKSSKSGKNKNKGPPPPPFQRSEVDESSQYDNRRPVNSVFTKSGLSGEDSVVSDPTLDAALHSAPAPVPVPTRNTSARIPRNHSDPTFDKDESVTSSPGSDSPEKGYRRSSSDELPPSEKNSSGSRDEKVDNIVAAALAYAEKTHSLTSFDHQSGSPARQSHKVKKRPSGSSSSRRRRRKSDPEVRSSQSTSSAVGSSAVGSSAVGSAAMSGASAALSGASLHSFYSGDDGKKSLESKGTQPSVQDMVSAALAYAEETRQQQRQRSEKSQSSSKHTKSVGSMFSDSDAGSYGADEKSEFQC